MEKNVDGKNAAGNALRLYRAGRIRRNRRKLLGVVGIAGFVLLWQLGSGFGILDPVFVSSPAQVFWAAVAMVRSGDLATHFGSTARVLFSGLIIAFFLGVTAGLIIGWFPAVHELLDPVVAGVYSVPYVAFLPMIIMWTGIGDTSRTIIVIWSALFPLLINSIQGVREVNRDYVRVAQSLSASRTQIFLTVALPASLPFILAGLRLAVGRALVGVIVAEFFMASSGLGYYINVNANALQMAPAFAAILVIALLGVLLVGIVSYFEVRFRSWS